MRLKLAIWAMAAAMISVILPGCSPVASTPDVVPSTQPAVIPIPVESLLGTWQLAASATGSAPAAKLVTFSEGGTGAYSVAATEGASPIPSVRFTYTVDGHAIEFEFEDGSRERVQVGLLSSKRLSIASLAPAKRMESGEWARQGR